MSPHLTAFQITVLETYDHGDFAYLAKLPSQEFDEELARCGDTLLKFILIELSHKEDCLTISDAIRRLATASDDIATAIGKLYELPADDHPNQ